MKWIAAILLVVVTVGEISGRRIRRGYDSSEYINGKIERESGEHDASGSGERISECGGDGGKGYDNSPEVAYNRDGRTPEDHHGSNGRAFSTSSASASASSSSYNTNHKTNLIPA